MHLNYRHTGFFSNCFKCHDAKCHHYFTGGIDVRAQSKYMLLSLQKKKNLTQTELNSSAIFYTIYSSIHLVNTLSLHFWVHLSNRPFQWSRLSLSQSQNTGDLNYTDYLKRFDSKTLKTFFFLNTMLRKHFWTIQLLQGNGMARKLLAKCQKQPWQQPCNLIVSHEETFRQFVSPSHEQTASLTWPCLFSWKNKVSKAQT